MRSIAVLQHLFKQQLIHYWQLFPEVVDSLAALRLSDSGIVKFHFFSATASLSRKSRVGRGLFCLALANSHSTSKTAVQQHIPASSLGVLFNGTPPPPAIRWVAEMMCCILHEVWGLEQKESFEFEFEFKFIIMESVW